MKIMRRKWIKLTTEEKFESRQIEQIDVKLLCGKYRHNRKKRTDTIRNISKNLQKKRWKN